MSGWDQRPDKQAKKPVHAQEAAQARDVQPTAPKTPQRPQTAKPQEGKPESQTPTDKLGAVLMALAGKSPRAMPETLTWSQSGSVTVVPQEGAPLTLARETQVQQLRETSGRAQAVARALTGQDAQVVAAQPTDATWTALVDATTRGQTVVAGGGDDEPTERHGRSRAALVTAVAETENQRTITLLADDGTEESVSFEAFCATFAEVAIVDSQS